MNFIQKNKKKSLFKIFLFVDIGIILLSLGLSSAILFGSNVHSAHALTDEQNKTQITWIEENIRSNYARLESVASSIQYDSYVSGMLQRNFYGNEYVDFMERSEELNYLRKKVNDLAGNLSMEIRGVVIYLNSAAPYRILEEAEGLIYYDNALLSQEWYRHFMIEDTLIYYLGRHTVEFQPRENQVISLVMKLQNISRTDLYGSVFVNVEAENFYRSIAAVYEKNDSFQVEISDSAGVLYSNFSPTGTVQRIKIEPYGITVSCSSGVNFAWIAFRQSCPALLIFLMTGLGFLTISIAMLKKIFKHIRNVFDEIHACVCLKKLGPEESRYREIDYFIRSFNSLLLEVDSLIRERVIREAEQKNAKLLSLQYQINPHFLFNMLEVFRMRLVALGDEEAADSVADFGNIMRYNISDDSKMTTLREEIDISRRFVGLYRFKYKDSLSFSVKLEERLGEIKTLKFILQPIVENSIKYGKKTIERKMHIEISAKEENGFLFVDVSDDGAGFTPERLEQIQNSLCDDNGAEKSIGLKNVFKRIKLFYGSEGDLLIRSEKDVSTSVTIKIPVRGGEEKNGDFIAG